MTPIYMYSLLEHVKVQNHGTALGILIIDCSNPVPPTVSLIQLQITCIKYVLSVVKTSQIPGLQYSVPLQAFNTFENGQKGLLQYFNFIRNEKL